MSVRKDETEFDTALLAVTVTRALIRLGGANEFREIRPGIHATSMDGCDGRDVKLQSLHVVVESLV
jgi:hypothetical protein